MIRSAAFAFLMLATPVLATLRLPSVLGPHMVLQRNTAVSIWGWAEPGQVVHVSAAWKQAPWTAKADEQGRWRAHVDTPDATADPQTLTIIAGQETIELRDVLIGEVWLASGQSNIQQSVADSRDAETEIPAANYPNIRLAQVTQAIAATPMDDAQLQWQACSPETIRNFSAVAYYFGRKLHEDLDVPVGLIQSGWGGTRAEAWTSLPALTTLSDLTSVREFLGRGDESARQASIKDPNDLSALFNAMIHPLIPFTIRGAIWYQGESNADHALGYRQLLPAMIADWRQRWGLGDFPFLIVQLANYTPVLEAPADSTWAELREAQLLTAENTPNVYAISAIDIGDPADIHPRNKQDVGKRLALAAEANTYGRDIVWSGPTYNSSSVNDGKFRIAFDHVAGGLTTPDGEALKGFAIAGEDRQFVWADARIEGNEVIVWSDAVKNPVAVRYAWANNPACNLYNSAGLPANPFRTDDWPGITPR